MVDEFLDLPDEPIAPAPVVPVAAPGSRTGMDIAGRAARGVIGNVRGLVDAVPDFLGGGPSGAASEFLQEQADEWERLESPAAKAQAAAAQKEMENLGPHATFVDRGLMKGKQALLDPAGTLAEGFGNVLPSIAVGAGGKLLGLGAKALAIIQGSAAGAGAIRGNIADTVKSTPDADMMSDPDYAALRSAGVDEAAAKMQIATKLSSYAEAFPEIAMGSALGALTGMTGTDEALFGAMGAGRSAAREALMAEARNASLRGAAKGLVKEGVSEGIQEGAETYLGNVGGAAGGADIDPYQNVPESIAAAAVMSAVPGAAGEVAGGLQSRSQLRALDTAEARERAALDEETRRIAAAGRSEEAASDAARELPLRIEAQRNLEDQTYQPMLDQVDAARSEAQRNLEEQAYGPTLARQTLIEEMLNQVSPEPAVDLESEMQARADTQSAAQRQIEDQAFQPVIRDAVSSDVQRASEDQAYAPILEAAARANSIKPIVDAGLAPNPSQAAKLLRRFSESRNETDGAAEGLLATPGTTEGLGAPAAQAVGLDGATPTGVSVPITSELAGVPDAGGSDADVADARRGASQLTGEGGDAARALAAPDTDVLGTLVSNMVAAPETPAQPGNTLRENLAAPTANAAEPAREVAAGNDRVGVSHSESVPRKVGILKAERDLAPEVREATDHDTERLRSELAPLVQGGGRPKEANLHGAIGRVSWQDLRRYLPPGTTTKDLPARTRAMLTKQSKLRGEPLDVWQANNGAEWGIRSMNDLAERLMSPGNTLHPAGANAADSQRLDEPSFRAREIAEAAGMTAKQAHDAIAAGEDSPRLAALRKALRESDPYQTHAQLEEQTNPPKKESARAKGIRKIMDRLRDANRQGLDSFGDEYREETPKILGAMWAAGEAAGAPSAVGTGPTRGVTVMLHNGTTLIRAGNVLAAVTKEGEINVAAPNSAKDIISAGRVMNMLFQAVAANKIPTAWKNPMSDDTLRAIATNLHRSGVTHHALHGLDMEGIFRILRGESPGGQTDERTTAGESGRSASASAPSQESQSRTSEGTRSPGTGRDDGSLESGRTDDGTRRSDDAPASGEPVAGAEESRRGESGVRDGARAAADSAEPSGSVDESETQPLRRPLNVEKTKAGIQAVLPGALDTTSKTGKLKSGQVDVNRGPLFTQDEEAEKKADAAKQTSLADVDEAAALTDKNPSEAQIESGNYRKGKTRISGMEVSIENEAGTKRRPEWPTLQSHYGGFIRNGQMGKDGENVDVFVKPGTPSDYAGPVFVVNQYVNGRFDETKTMLGFADEAEARAAYNVNYTPDWKGLKSLAAFPDVESFKEWLREGDHTKPAKGVVSTSEGIDDTGQRPTERDKAQPGTGEADAGEADARPADSGPLVGERPSSGSEAGTEREADRDADGTSAPRKRVSRKNVRSGVQPPDGTGEAGTSRPSVPALNPPRDFTIENADSLGAGGAKAKYKANLDAIRIVKDLVATGRRASPDEQAKLVRFVGWGGLKQAFNPNDSDWRKEFNELREVLTPEEYAAARASTLNAHYTSGPIVNGIWSAMKRLGFTGGRVLEPAAGVGHFIGLAPKGSTFTAIELDKITGNILKQLYQRQNVLPGQGFQEVNLLPGSFDVAIGNPPFGNETLSDRTNKDLPKGFSIHNFFFAKAVDALRPGGVMGMVVSNSFMDAKTPIAREWIADRTKLLGAIRLPNNAFAKNANTEVTTDIVFLQKLPADEKGSRDWVDTGEYTNADGESMTLNRYFIEHPEMMLGDMKLAGTMYRGQMPALVAKPNQDTTAALNEAIAKLPENVYVQGARAVDTLIDVDGIMPKELKVGSLFVTNDGKIGQRIVDVEGQKRFTTSEPKNATLLERVRGLSSVREKLRDLMRGELKDATAADMEAMRKALNKTYDAFVKDYGYVNTQVNRQAFREDIDLPLLESLEPGFDPGLSEAVAKKLGEVPRKPSAGKADIFKKRVLFPFAPTQKADTPKEALLASLNERGKVDLPYMAEILGKSESDVFNALDGIVFKAPDGSFVHADEYLGGSVKAKLAEARAALAEHSEFQKNVEALEKVQPPDIEAVDISVRPGSSWVPGKDMVDFAKHLVGGQHSAQFISAVGKWTVNSTGVDGVRNSQTWGTTRAGAMELLRDMMSAKPTIIKDNLGTSREPHWVLNESETQLAQAKADEIATEFKDWIWADQARRDRLAKLYNDTFNTEAPKTFDGSHLTLPGASPLINLREHQKSVIWRTLQDGTVLLDHVVGAGKTFAVIGSVMEARRLGIARKPLIVVPNHLVRQWRDDFYKLYPNANILATTEKDFDKTNRQRLFAKITTGDWDAVIVAKDSLKKVGMPAEMMHEILTEQIDDVMQAIEEAKRANSDRNITRDLEKIRANLEEKLATANERTGKKDAAVSFDELGIDGIAIDEAHDYKNLFFTSTMRTAGLGNPKGSGRAFDLFVKLRYLTKRFGDKALRIFATGTPVSNSLVEMFTMQRYMQYAALKDRAIHNLDSWASAFGNIANVYEVDSSGTGYRLRSRFAQFVNMPELMNLYRSFADVITMKDLEDQAKKRGEVWPVPRVEGGKPRLIVADRSPEQERYFGIKERDPETGVIGWTPGSILARIENLPQVKDPREDNMLKITNDARKAGLDYRLVNENAPDFKGSKINLSADEITRVHNKWNADKGTQLVFLDLSTPKSAKGKAKALAAEKEAVEAGALEVSEEEAIARGEEESVSMDDLLAEESNFSVYEDLRAKLIARGIPENEIAFIHDYDTAEKKKKIFADVNSGRIRILFGSTGKMGAGMNVQERLVALHHIDAPWRPSDLEQREGRIIRQGNSLYLRDPQGFEVEVLRYATKQTYDTRMWQLIEHKANGVEQLRKGDAAMRVVEDVSGEAANAGEMKAAASGNPLIEKEIKLRGELRKLESLEQAFKRNKFQIEASIKNYRDNARRATQAAEGYEKLAKEIKPIEPFSITVKGKTFTEKSDASAAILEQFKKATSSNRESEIMNFRGVDFSFMPGSLGMDVEAGHDAIGDVNVTTYAKEEPLSPGGFLSRLNNWLDAVPKKPASQRAIVANAEESIERLYGESGKTFKQADDLARVRREHAATLNALKGLENAKPAEVETAPADEPDTDLAMGQTEDGEVLTLAVVNRAMPGLSWRQGADGAFTADLRGGRRIRVQPNAVIQGYSEEAAQRSAEAFGSNDVEAIGMFTSFGLEPEALIQIAEGAPTGTLEHEGIHFLWDIALRPDEKLALERQYGNEEKAAYAFSEWVNDRNRRPQTLFQKVVDFVKRLVHNFRPTWDSTFREVAGGRVAQRVGVPSATRTTSLAVAAPQLEPGDPTRVKQAGTGNVDLGRQTRMAPMDTAAFADRIKAASESAGTPDGKPLETLKPPDFHRNFEKVLNVLSPDEAAAFARVYNEFDKEMTTARRELSWETGDREALKLMGVYTRDQFLQLAQNGVTFNEPGLRAATRFLYEVRAENAAALRTLQDARSEGRGGPSSDEYRRFVETSVDLARWMLALRGEQAEAARAFNARKDLRGPRSETEKLLGRVFKDFGGLTEKQAAEVVAIAESDPTRLPDLLRRAFKPDFWDYINEWRKASMLSSVRTYGVNFFGNAMKQAMTLAEIPLAAGVDAARTLRTGEERQVYAGEVAAARAALAKYGPDALKTLIADTKGALKGVEKIDPTDARPFEMQVGVIPGRFGKGVRTIFRLMTAADDFFKKTAWAQSLYRQAYRKARNEGLHGDAAAARVDELIAIGEGSDWMAKDVIGLDARAKRAAEYETFTQRANWENSGAFGLMANLISQAEKKFKPIGIFFPFKGTPANIAYQAFERSPLGFIAVKNRAQELSDLRERIKTTTSPAERAELEKTLGEKAEELVNQAARAILGTAVFSVAAAMAAVGNLTGSGPAEPDKRRVWQAAGNIPTAVRIGDSDWYAYDRFDPISASIALAANIPAIQEEEGIQNKIAAFANAMQDAWVSKTYLQGVEQLADIMTDPARYSQRWLRDLQSSFVPAFMGQTADLLDPTLRDTTRGAFDPILGRLPGFSDDLPATRTGTGEPGTRTQRAGGNAPWNPFGFIRTGDADGDPLAKEFLEADYTPDAHKTYIQIGVGPVGAKKMHKVDLTDSELEAYRRADEQITKALRRAIARPEWQALPPEVKKSQISRAYARASDKVRDAILPKAYLRLRDELRGQKAS